MSRAAIPLLMLGLAGLVAGCVRPAGSRPAATAAPATATPATTTASPVATSAAPVSARVILPSRNLASGAQMAFWVVVDNRSGHALHAQGCLSLFAAALSSSAYHPGVPAPSCAQRFTVPTGESTYRVLVQATYLLCTMSHPTASDPKCLPHGMPGLPPGRYRVVVYPESDFVAAPAPVAVSVTRP